MTTLRDDLQRLLASFDDDALSALASKGLLRRAQKELERVQVAITAEDAAALTVVVGDQSVRLDRHGPAQARCSCPSRTTCQHVLVAVLALQRLLAPVASAGPVAAAPPDAATALHDGLMAITESALRDHAGAAGWRWAQQFADDFDLVRHLRVETKRTLVITLLQPHLVAHYGGGDVAALVLDTKLAQEEKHRAAVVLVYQRAHGKVVQPAEAPAGAQARLELGEDFTPATSAEAGIAAARERLRRAVRVLAHECLRCGLSHLSAQMQQRFATLAVSAQGAEYPRLARLLRRLADHVELLQQRAGGADEHRLLDELTIVHGLTTALEHAAAARRTPTDLVGRARSVFADGANLDLLGLGARPFRSPAGYAGLTMLFWSPAEQAFLSCTDARPLTMRHFDPLVRYRQPGPWTGLGAPQQATGRRITLTAARRNDQGRLSAAARTHAIVQPAGDAFAAMPAVDRWSELPERLETALPTSLLAEPRPLLQWVLLAPAQWQPAVFDAIRQELTWPLVDRDGATLPARLPWTPLHQHAIERLERRSTATPAAGTHVVAHLRRHGTTLIAEPMSLVRAQQASPVDCLFFDPAGDGAGTGATPGARPAATAAVHASPTPAPALPATLGLLRTLLRSMAERGLPTAREAAAVRELDGLLAKAHGEGLTAFRRGHDTAGSDAAALVLRTNFVLLQYERVLATAEEDDPGDP